jgi:hypothetical protein
LYISAFSVLLASIPILAVNTHANKICVMHARQTLRTANE